jgi:hypothetical protein
MQGTTKISPALRIVTVTAVALVILLPGAVLAQTAAKQTPAKQTTINPNATGDQIAAQQVRERKEPIKQPVTAAGCKNALAPGKPYFIEFRSRGAVSYGHTFVFHGRLGSGNKFASFKVAGLHPKGEDPSTYMQGHWMPVDAETGASWGDLDEQYLTARFCVTLTEAEYKKASAYIAQLQREKKTWHAMTYNCNSFGADIARFIGLDTPNPNMYMPETFIKRLAEDNRKKPGGGFTNPFASSTTASGGTAVASTSAGSANARTDKKSEAAKSDSGSTNPFVQWTKQQQQYQQQTTR